MPIQNVGTLLENLVVVEAASHLLTRCADTGATLEFVNAFAMPPLSEWRPNAQNAGFNDRVLDRVLAASDATTYQAGVYPYLLSRVLTYNRQLGPNAALLVLGAWRQHKCVALRLWLNDLRNGHYGDAVDPLNNLAEVATTVGLVESSQCPSIGASVCEEPYPESLTALSRFVAESKAPGVRLCFLDPLRYRIRDRQGPETSSDDHRAWLRTVAFDGLTVALHFTGNSDHPTFREELSSLYSDASAQGYVGSRVFRRQHYAVFVAVRDPNEADGVHLAAALESRICRAWQQWCAVFTDLHNDQLRVERY